jgi:hypothetical protein
MRLSRWVGRRVPLAGLGLVGLTLLFLPGAVLGDDWTSAKRVSSIRGSRLDSLHQLAADSGAFHLVHPRLEAGAKRDRVVYQRSLDGGATWGRERVIFTGLAKHPNVVPNLAIDADGPMVAVAWRAKGPTGTVLYVRTSSDRGLSFGLRVAVAAAGAGIGVPAIALGDDLIAVAWTERRSGVVKVRVSRNGGSSFRKPRRLGRTRLSISCKKRVLDGLVGATARGKRIHIAWSYAPERSCQASRINVKSSADRGAQWGRRRTITKLRSYGWPELDARGNTVMATVQLPTGDLLVARSAKNGRAWKDRVLKARDGHLLSAGDVVLLPKKKARLTYVDERIRKGRLLRTSLITRRSSTDGRKFGASFKVMDMAQRLRLAPNVAASGDALAIVFQSGGFDGSPRDLYVSRPR